jgi:hypothetical protein
VDTKVSEEHTASIFCPENHNLNFHCRKNLQVLFYLFIFVRVFFSVKLINVTDVVLHGAIKMPIFLYAYISFL